jgi:hypothetical protein
MMTKRHEGFLVQIIEQLESMPNVDTAIMLVPGGLLHKSSATRESQLAGKLQGASSTILWLEDKASGSRLAVVNPLFKVRQKSA